MVGNRAPGPTVCFVALHRPRGCGEPAEFLASVPLMRELPLRIARKGFEVSVVQAFPSTCRFDREGVTYFFERTGRLSSRASRIPAVSVLRRVRALRPDLIHLHGLTLHLGHALLVASVVDRPRIVVQYHGGYPSPNPLARGIQRHNLSRADRFLFTTHEHARPFLDTGLIPDPDRVVAFMETSSSFRPMERQSARGRSGIEGDPVCLSTARLHPDKDPMTVIRGFERILSTRPGARLYLFYLTGELFPELQAYVHARPDLRKAIRFCGRAERDRMETIYNSADFLLQASRREFSGCAVLEAMACGVVPVVTDIPSFRAMTGGGSVGILFPLGDADALARGVLSIPPKDLPAQQALVRDRFVRELSFAALGDRLDAVYRELLPVS